MMARKIATLTVIKGITSGTRKGRGACGWVLRRMMTHDMAPPYVIQMRNDASSTSTPMSPASTKSIEMKP